MTTIILGTFCFLLLIACYQGALRVEDLQNKLVEKDVLMAWVNHNCPSLDLVKSNKDGLFWKTGGQLSNQEASLYWTALKEKELCTRQQQDYRELAKKYNALFVQTYGFYPLALPQPQLQNNTTLKAHAPL